MNTPTPVGIELHRKSKTLELQYADDQRHLLPCEYLRVYSPSAEVKGHGPGQEVLQTGKLHVTIDAINPVGHYALQLVFSDGHDSGIFSWEYLWELIQQQEPYWQNYLDRLASEGGHRDPDTQVVRIGL